MVNFENKTHNNPWKELQKDKCRTKCKIVEHFGELISVRKIGQIGWFTTNKNIVHAAFWLTAIKRARQLKHSNGQSC